METFNDTPQDITATGPTGLKGLPGIRTTQSKRTREDALNDLKLGVRAYTPRDYGKMYSDYEYDETDPNGYGSSRSDPNFITPYQLENLEDTRAQRQSDFSKITNGIIKGVTTTGTTFADGTVGLVWGLGQGIVNALDGDKDTSFTSGLWNNQFNQWMNQANEWMEQVAPNYYTNDEREHPMSHIFNANFIGDKFIKNLGFTAGALGSAVAFGGVYGSAGKLLGKAALGLGTAGRTAVGISKAASMGIGAVAAATTEGSIEALQAAQQMGEENQQLYTDLRNSNIQEIMDNPNLNDYEKELLIEDENDKYNKVMDKLEEDKAKVGNATLAWNIPILTAGNIIQFNKLLGGGFRSASRAAKVAGKMGELRPGGFFEKTAAQRAAKAFYKSGHTEGREEVLQQIASDASNTRYSLELNDYYKSLYDPEANTQASDYMAGVGKQILATLGREDTWEQYLIGSMTGVMGAPVFGKKNTQTRADFGKGKRIGWSGGALGQYNEITEDRERNQRVADYLNERAKDPKFRDQYQRLVRHMYFQDKMDAALDEGLEKEFKDSEFAQLYNDIMWFTYAGKKDVLKDMVSGALNNITDEEAAEIVKDTTKTVTNEEGKEVTTGPFIGADGNPMTPDQIREKVAKSKQDVLNLMQKIEDEYDALDHNTNGKLSDEQLEQLTYMKLQIDDWRERTKSVGEDIGNFFEGIVKEFQTRLDSNKAILEASPNNETAKHNVEVLEKNIKVMQETATTLKGFTALERMGAADHQQARKIFGQAIRNLDKIDQRGIDQDQKAKVTTGLQDLIKMSQSSEIFQKRRDQYLENPDLMLNDRDEIIKQMEKEELEERANKQMQSLTNAENIEAFDKAVNDSDDDEAMQQAIDDLASSGNTMARQYKSNQAIAQRQKEKVRSLIGTEIPTLNGGTMTVSQEDAEAVEAIIDNRRLNTNPAEKDGTSFINTEQMTNPFLDDMNGLWESGLGIDTATEEGIARSKRIQDIFHYVATQAKEDEAADDVIDDEDVDFNFEEGSEPAPDETTGADGVSTVPPVTTGKPAASVIEPEIAPTTSEDLKNQREKDIKTNPEDSIPKDSTGKRTYWKNNIPQYGVKERAAGRISAPLAPDGTPYQTHTILAKLGAFEYVNSGKLRAGDKVKFVIDPSFAKDIQDDSIRQQVEGAIWIVSAKDNQVIGILPQDRDTINKYAGLAEFSDSLVQQWRDGGKQRLESSVTTEVQDLKAGFVPYIEEEKDLSTIQTSTPKFTVVEETTAFGTKKTLRVSIPSITGKSINPLVKIKNFDSTLLGDTKFKSSKLYRDFYNEVQSVIRKIQDSHRDFTAITDDEALELSEVISKYLYTSYGKANALHVNPSTSSRGGITLRASGQNKIIDVFKIQESLGGFSMGQEASSGPVISGGRFMSTDNIVSDIMNELAGFGMPIQVAFSQVGNQAYMKDRFDAGVLTSNLESVSLYDEWYTLKPVTEVNGKWQMAGQEKVKTEEAAGERAAAAAKAASEPETPSVPEVTGTPTPKRPEQKRKPARRVRAVDRKTWKRMKQEEEVAWLEKALPQVAAEDRLKFTKGLIDVADMGKEAWGLFDKGIVTISDIAAEGTIYHEAFHTVFNMLLNEDEKQALFNSAKKLWPRATDEIDLEERLAEEFRRYVMHRQDNSRPKNLGARIMNFFAQLWEKVKNWYSPTMYNYFAKINEGYYADAELNDTDAVRARDYVKGIQSEEDAYNRIMDLWNHPWGTTIYRDRNGKRHDVKVIGRGPKGVEFRFSTEREAIDFQNWWWDQVDASFSPIWYDRENNNYRVYMHKPGMISQKEAAERERLSAPQQTEYDKLSDDEKETLKSRGYSAEDFNSLSDTEQQAVKECFFVL